MNGHPHSSLSRCFSLIILLLLASNLASCAPTSPSVINPPLFTLRVVLDNNYSPYVFQDDQGNLQGILIDQWKVWEARAGSFKIAWA